MTTLVIGSEAVCSDGYRGEVLALVVDPAARTVTHLVVEPHGRAGLARLVPLELADLAGLLTLPTLPMRGRVRSGCVAPKRNS